MAIAETHKRYSRQINFREGCRGHLWQGRFASFLMDESYLIACDYILSFKPITGWNTPDSQKVILSSNILIITAEYQPPNLKNLIESLQILCEIENPDHTEYLDLNGDGKINLIDAMLTGFYKSSKGLKTPWPPCCNICV